MTTLTPKALVLTIKPGLERFYMRAGRMSQADYQIDDILGDIISLLSDRELIDYGVIEMVNRMQTQSGRDGEILAEAWHEFFAYIFTIYKSLNVWDATGQTTLQYHRLINDGDIVLFH